jgi:DNA-binding MarR family transcriptional regulator
MSKKEKENNSDKESLKAKYRDIDSQIVKAKELIEQLEVERSLLIKQIVEAEKNGLIARELTPDGWRWFLF